MQKDGKKEDQKATVCGQTDLIEHYTSGLKGIATQDNFFNRHFITTFEKVSKVCHTYASERGSNQRDEERRREQGEDQISL